MLKRKGDGELFLLHQRNSAQSFYRALALKALDQRIASSNTSRDVSSQPTGGSASLPASAGAVTDTAAPKPQERRKSVSEVDIGVPQIKKETRDGSD